MNFSPSTQGFMQPESLLVLKCLSVSVAFLMIGLIILNAKYVSFFISRLVCLPVWPVQVHSEAEMHPSEPALQWTGRLRRC